MTATPPPKALSGLRVLDVSRFIAGPFCAMQLGDHGADVVKVERIGLGDDTRVNHPQVGGQSLYFLGHNRNKRSLAIDFRHPEGPPLLRRLAAEADVLIENFRPGTMEAMGCGWEVLSALNPRLVMVRISGFGQTGPWAERPCFDVIAQAMSGIMEMTGQPGGPPTMAGTFVIDYATALYATIGTLTAIQARHITGRGQLVEATLMESAISFLITAIPEQLLLGRSAGRHGNRDRYTAPANSFRAGDGSWVHITAGTDPLFTRFARAIGRLGLLQDARFSTAAARVAHVEEVEAEVSRWIEGLTAIEAVSVLEEAGIPCAKIATVAEVVTNPQLRDRGQIAEVEHPTAGRYPTHGVTVSLADTPGGIDRPPPLLGEHTAEILRDWLGASETEVKALVEQKVLS